MVVSGCIHFIKNIITPFFFVGIKKEKHLIVCIFHVFLLHSSVVDAAWLHSLAAVNSAAINRYVRIMPAWGCLPNRV